MHCLNSQCRSQSANSVPSWLSAPGASPHPIRTSQSSYASGAAASSFAAIAAPHGKGPLAPQSHDLSAVAWSAEVEASQLFEAGEVLQEGLRCDASNMVIPPTKLGTVQGLVPTMIGPGCEVSPKVGPASGLGFAGGQVPVMTDLLLPNGPAVGVPNGLRWEASPKVAVLSGLDFVAGLVLMRTGCIMGHVVMML